MAYKRQILPEAWATGDLLTAQLESIGIRVTGRIKILEEVNIEDTLVAASREGIMLPDYRILSLLVDWIQVHGERVNVDRLVRIVDAISEMRVRVFWAAIAQWMKADSRYKKLAQLYSGKKIDLLESGTDFLITKNGLDERFVKTFLRIPNKTLRHRLSDILGPEDLARKHLAFRYRVLIGPTYRADMMAYLEKHPKASASEVARATYGSFASAWQAKKDFEVMQSVRKKRSMA